MLFKRLRTFHAASSKPQTERRRDKPNVAEHRERGSHHSHLQRIILRSTKPTTISRVLFSNFRNSSFNHSSSSFFLAVLFPVTSPLRVGLFRHSSAFVAYHITFNCLSHSSRWGKHCFCLFQVRCFFAYALLVFNYFRDLLLLYF